MSSVRITARITCCLATLLPSIAHGQVRDGRMIPPGTFVGRDSLDTRREPATPSRVRASVTGTATWTIELDSLDLRRKFTLRIALPVPAPVTIVLRAFDSLPPAPGTYDVMIASTGASHGSRWSMHGDVYAREGSHDRRYFPLVTKIVVASVATDAGQPLITGKLEMLSHRYADGKPGQMVFDNVMLRIDGDFAAHAAENPMPTIAVTPAMQEAVLQRAIDGFMITSAEAANGDGDADSTHETARARAFLESRWHHAAVIEKIEANGMQFVVRLRGRYAPVVCEASWKHEDAECVELPAPVSASGGPGTLVGSVAVGLAKYLPGADGAIAVHLLPNPAPLKDAYAAWCARRDATDRIGEQAFEKRLTKASAAQQEAEAQRYMLAFQKAELGYRKEYRKLFASFATRHASVDADGRFSFSGLPPGNYLLHAALPSEERVEWYVPVVVHGGEQLARDLDASNVNRRGWACGTPLPFAAVREGDGGRR